MTDTETEVTLAKVQETMISTVEALHLARARVEILSARIVILEAENELLREAASLATKAEGERILTEFERRWPAARRGA
jgi:hypothetical protein